MVHLTEGGLSESEADAKHASVPKLDSDCFDEELHAQSHPVTPQAAGYRMGRSIQLA